MSDAILRCPHCMGEVPLSESLAAPLLQTMRVQFQQQLAEKDRLVQARELALTQRSQALELDARMLEQRIAEQTDALVQKARIEIAAAEAERAAKRIAENQSQQQQALQNALSEVAEKNLKLAQAQQEQADYMRKARELDDRVREVDITVEKRVQLALAEIRQHARTEAEQALQLKLMEKDRLLAATQAKLSELTQRVEQGNLQLQGEVLEIALENSLKTRFPFDLIEPVPKGESGADVVQTVLNAHAHICGKMLWETKRTKHFSEAWIAKLKDDQRLVHADVAILVSQSMPKEINHFGLIDGVWVVAKDVAMPVAHLLRESLMQLASAKLVGIGVQSKTQLIYSYLTGPRFRARVEAMVDAFRQMQDDLAKERRVIKRQWAKREMQIERISSATVGMWGELQGIVGKSLQEIEGLEWGAMPALDTAHESSEEPGLVGQLPLKGIE